MYLLIPQVSRRTDPDLALLERLAHQRGRQVPAVFRLWRTTWRSARVRRILHVSTYEPERECRFCRLWSLWFLGIHGD